jgi:hypothetical protein
MCIAESSAYISVLQFEILNEELYLTINSEQLQHSACEKLLGIKIDSNLNAKNQIDQVYSKISSKIYLLSKIKKYLNPQLFK